MKLCILVFMLFVTGVVAQELPEPTGVDIAADVTQDFEIRWFDGTWENIIPTSLEFVDGEVGVHKYLSLAGQWTFEASVPYTSTPRKMVFVLDILGVPEYPAGTIRWWGFFRCRCRVRATVSVGEEILEQVGEWSESSYWVLVVKLFVPLVPIHI